VIKANSDDIIGFWLLAFGFWLLAFGFGVLPLALSTGAGSGAPSLNSE